MSAQRNIVITSGLAAVAAAVIAFLPLTLIGLPVGVDRLKIWNEYSVTE